MSQPKTEARRCAVQALYQWQMAGDNLAEIEAQFLISAKLKGSAKRYFGELLHGIPKELDALDKAMGGFIDRPINEIDSVERAILRIGAYELLFKPEIPYRVVLNEGINLAKRFGADQSHKYVNGVLDKISCEQRGTERSIPRSG
ncbi:MAG: transcription antitermination factor NusB [Gammaproteobacteria bacterium]|nr:MAG: transcription antitermination factor NusB [Gammaproteobacteria bacterium]RLA24637.1 MAG: transcription antitermination factor NusB [Gammaproteobacteria bacterium]